ncbi:FYN-binding protein 1 isoform X1 [Dicentrarchus labrax]|uniref:Helically-extended SH3 domain-containing protein n=1 Tax=Dicentrarchus labrax TaxID=13489 RepID=A0A8P4FXI9_DICLA|nr:FYN-binding protein 1 isoform X1 [Dicentrarchus labrax]XP_051232881.1 FYN-binding protein 1 isoform X1 [Dicentrarchus labrax]
MDQENTMDFKALRAKFQDQEILLQQQPRIKPALPEKPKVVPPPQSPPHYLPAGARPSLLTSINESLEGKALIAPRVVFKDDTKESKMPLIPANSQGKNKSEGKLRKGKDKTTKGSKEKLDEDPSDQKQKKEHSKDKRFSLLHVAPKESTSELVPATPPPKATTSKKKGFLVFKKSSKRNSVEVPENPILDAPSSDVPVQAPLIPVPSEFSEVPPEPEISAPKALLPNIPTLLDSSAAVEITPPSTVPAFVPDIPADVPTPESETPIEIETPALPISRPASQNEIIPSPPDAVPTPPPSRAVSGPPPVASTPSPSLPEPEIAAEAGAEAVNIVAVEQLLDPPSIPMSPKDERPISALSVLERAEDIYPAKRTSQCDQRIFNALEKARRKTSPLTHPTSSSVTPPPEDLPPPQSPTCSLPDLPPIDYEDRGGNALLKTAQLNGFDHRQVSPVLEGITEEGSDAVPELLMVPPPPPRKVLPDHESLGPAPAKPDRPPSVNLSEFIPSPPSLEDNEIPAPPEFSETDTTDLPEFDDVASDAHSSSLQTSDWGNGEYTGPDSPDVQNMPEFYSNGITTPGAEVHAALDRDTPQPESSFLTSQESSPQAELQAGVNNDVYESTENVYEDIATSATKKKGKTDGGKKRKGPPKNPYAEAQQETNEEKSKTGRFGKIDKKAAAEGPDEKELKKKEKQRLEKEKKELKEKQEREKKEQKEREKKENEMKKKFKITGHEDAMYEAKVTATTKGRKNDLPVKSGDMISIIRTTNCPKGKWLAKDSSNNYGYVSVDHVELDIKEMLELGKKAAITRMGSNSNVIEPEVTSTGSRASNHYPLSAESFSDDSEEWTGDDDETLSPPPETAAPMGHTRTLSMPDMGNKDLSVNHQHSRSETSSDGSQARHEALQKLATFFHSPKPAEPAASSTEPEPETSPVLVKEEAVHLPVAVSTQEMDFDQTDILILPPPLLYADLTVE